MITESLGMEVSKDNTFGVHLDNGSYTGIFGQLQRGVEYKT